MKVQRDENTRAEVINRLRKAYSRPREGRLHVSDILYPRKAYWGRKRPDIPLTDREVLFFLAGRGHHGMFQDLEKSKNTEVELVGEDIEGHVDIFKDCPIEIKTTRSQMSGDPNELRTNQPQYFQQLGIYCYLSEKRRGQLWVLYLYAITCPGCGSASLWKGEIKGKIKTKDGAEKERTWVSYKCKKCEKSWRYNQIRKSPHLETYQIQLDDADIAEFKEYVNSRTELLNTALKTEDYEMLPLCPEYFCQTCKYLDFCRPGWKPEEKD